MGLVPGRLADGPGRASDLPLEPRVRRGVPARAARPQGGRYLRLAVRHRRLPNPPRLRGRRGPGPLRKRLARRNIKLLLDFVPNHTAPDHPWVHEAPRVLHPGQRGGSGARSRRTTPGSKSAARTRSSPTGAIPTSTAGRTPSSSTTATPAFARRESPSSARSPSAATAFAATWRCCCSREIIEQDLGRSLAARRTAPRPRTIRSGRRPSPPSSGGTPTSCSWPRSTGTWSGRCSRPASTTPTTSASTIGWWRRPPRRSAST